MRTEHQPDRRCGRLEAAEQACTENNLAKAGASLAGFEAAPELGYVVISGEMRGQRLSRWSRRRNRRANYRADLSRLPETIRMRNNLERSDFVRVGGEWQGKKGMLSLWTITP